MDKGLSFYIIHAKLMELCRVSLSLKNSQMRRTSVIKDLWLSVQLLNCILHESLLFLQRAFSTGSDPHQLLTFFSQSTHVCLDCLQGHGDGEEDGPEKFQEKSSGTMETSS